jgi:hypothetical protein
MDGATYHETLLRQQAPLEKHEISSLREWLQVLREDCEDFGPAHADLVRMQAIEDRIAAEMAR